MFSREQLITTLKNVRLYNSASQIYHITQLILRQPKRLKNRLFPGTIILLYHRVIDLKTDPQLLAVSPEHFYEHMNYLKNNYNIISLDDLKEAMKSKKLPKKSVVITFDDGYVDNYLNAKPVLEKLQIPATIFVTTDHIGSTREFWWDDLERLLLQPESLPVSLALTIDNKIHSWKMESKAKGNSYNPEKYSHWNVTMNETPTPRHHVYRELCNLLRPMDHSTREEILNELARWAGLEENFRQDFRTMSVDEVRSLPEDSLIEVGGHTYTHPVLSSLSSRDQIREIEENKKCLETILARPVTSFSYPFGTKYDYTAETAAIVQDSGFTCACSNFPDIVYRGTDRYQLPRFVLRNWDVDEFARHLKVWFHG